MFDDKSRYRGLAEKTFVEADGFARRYVARRFLPDPAGLRVLATVRVTDSDRLDLMAHRQLGEATAGWRIADANGAMDPADLLVPTGRRLRIPSAI